MQITIKSRSKGNSEENCEKYKTEVETQHLPIESINKYNWDLILIKFDMNK